MTRKRPGMNIGAAVLFAFFGLLFFVLIVRIVTIQVTGEAEGKVLASQAAKKYIKSGILEAKRGTIYDEKGEVISENTSAYTLVAILDSSMTSNPKDPKHVTDPDKTASALSEYIDLSKSEIYERLTIEGDPFQVEFGSAGRDLTHQLMQKISKEELPGITFRKESKRFYPNGTFASHLIGFAQEETLDNGDTKTVGKMGIEQSLNEFLSGTDGKIQYKSDVWGYLLPNTEEHVTPPKNGNDVYLTINKKIQTFLEEAMNEVAKDYNPKKMFAIVADPKTGKILAMSERPTFHPDTREGLDGNWRNMIVEDTYEPGSTFKTFSLAAAVDSGVFDPNAYYESGTIDVSGASIRDHNYGNGWGTITFLEGLQRSSNTAFVKLLDLIGEDKYKQYLESFGFGKPTNVGLPNEASGKILYHYPVEKATTIFGQGTTVTPLQMIQAETAIANDGKMMKPYVIDKIVNLNSDEIVKQTKPEVVGNPISAESAKKVREYLATTVTSDVGTGRPFAIEGYDVAGKSGTAQIPGDNGKYMTGRENYLFSFIGMAPKDNPQLIVYVGVQQPELPDTEIGSVPVSKIFNPVMQNSLKYLNIKPEEKVDLKKLEMPDLNGQNVNKAVKNLEKKGLDPVIIGNGSTIEEQLPAAGEEVLEGEKVMLRTGGQLTVPDMKGWSVRDVFKVASIANLRLNKVGHGYVSSQNLRPNSPAKENELLVVNFKAPDAPEEEPIENDESMPQD